MLNIRADTRTLDLMRIIRGMYSANLIAVIVVNVCGVYPRYINDIHGNTVVQEKSTGFHVLELHGFTVGVTSSIFVGAALTICATYVAFRLGLGRVFNACCCSRCSEERQQTSELTVPTVPSAPQAVQLIPAVQQTQGAISTAVQHRSNSDGNMGPGNLGPFTVKIVR